MIHTVTLNPALDKILFVRQLDKSITNRVTGVINGIGGKGAHVSANLRLMERDNIAWGVCYGAQGKEFLRILTGHGADARFIYKEGQNTRMNYLLIEENGDCTLVSEIGPQVLQEDFDELIRLLRESINEGDILALSGDVTNCGPDVYPRIISALKDKRPKIAIDASGPALVRCMEESLYLIKPNIEELSTLCGRPVSSDAGDVLKALHELEHCRTEIIAVSMGAEGSVLKTPDGIWRALPLAVNVKNTIGCGDVFLSGLLSALDNELTAEASLRRAAAFSSAAAEWPDSVGFEPERPAELMDKVEIIKLA